ncbi:GlcNAc-transferase family protein [Cupriavidus basilensis]|uniref:GlcNAc-transferase family protein n=1 Tax=Cupriavidus basilensis TaxID=68895 RepID=UPI0007514C8B|nr:GlcNAc-transferase family protein [Cupriavidus basilensis]
MKPTIFVQMASYRDPELIPTLRDLIERADRPDMLRIVVCWQHALHETVSEFFARGFAKWRLDASGQHTVHTLAYGDASIELIDVPHMASQGACWARNLIQQQYRAERYTLQLDSHHRFVDGWDSQLTDMLESLRAASPKPVLTAYLPSYFPHDDPGGRRQNQLEMRFSHFSKRGVVVFCPARLSHATPRQPVPARFYSGHFTFADGSFSVEVQHDPQYFFLGEEISIAARAYTHGYDLYHPHRLIAWHEYTRKGRTKIWDDHSAQAKADGAIPMYWGERDNMSYQRNRALFGIDGEPRGDAEFGPYGLGSERTLAEYETYAGIDFTHRGVQRATLEAAPPAQGMVPARGTEAEWKASLVRSNELRLCLHRKTMNAASTKVHTCRMTVHDATGSVLHHRVMEAEEFGQAMRGEWFDRNLIFTSGLGQLPASYVVELLDDAGEQLGRIEQAVEA